MDEYKQMSVWLLHRKSKTLKSRFLLASNSLERISVASWCIGKYSGVEMIYIVYKVLSLLRHYFRVLLWKRKSPSESNFTTSPNTCKDMLRNPEHMWGISSSCTCQAEKWRIIFWTISCIHSMESQCQERGDPTKQIIARSQQSEWQNFTEVGSAWL